MASQPLHSYTRPGANAWTPQCGDDVHAFALGRVYPCSGCDAKRHMGHTSTAGWSGVTGAIVHWRL
eukprot:554864-Pyramimonas_sp.AAC.2